MRKYKIIHLNKGLRLSREKDLNQSEEILNEYISKGWILQQVVSPNDGLGALVAFIYKEN